MFPNTRNCIGVRFISIYHKLFAGSTDGAFFIKTTRCGLCYWATTVLSSFSYAGDPLNIKMPSYQYRDPRVKDKKVSRPCCQIP